MPRHKSGRTVTHEYRCNRRALLERSNRCHLCGHGGALTADHIVTPAEWLRRYGTLAGVDSLANLAPAHGTMRPGHLNRCPVCGRLCNQSRSDRPLIDPNQSRW